MPNLFEMLVKREQKPSARWNTTKFERTMGWKHLKFSNHLNPTNDRLLRLRGFTGRPGESFPNSAVHSLSTISDSLLIVVMQSGLGVAYKLSTLEHICFLNEVPREHIIQVEENPWREELVIV